jgi:hypothetical protein
MSVMIPFAYTINWDIFSSVRHDPDLIISELRLGAAVMWDELGEVSQSKAAEIACINWRISIA